MKKILIPIPEGYNAIQFTVPDNLENIFQVFKIEMKKTKNGERLNKNQQKEKTYLEKDLEGNWSHN